MDYYIILCKCVQLLISKGFNVNIEDKELYTPLHNAVYNGHTEVVCLKKNN